RVGRLRARASGSHDSYPLEAGFDARTQHSNDCAPAGRAAGPLSTRISPVLSNHLPRCTLRSTHRRWLPDHAARVGRRRLGPPPIIFRYPDYVIIKFFVILSGALFSEAKDLH